MALEKKDIKTIETIVDRAVDKAVEKGIEKFAIIVGKSFNAVEAHLTDHDKRFDAHDKRFDAHDAQFRNINARLDLIETDLANLRELHKEIRIIRELLDEMVTRREFEKLEQRLLRVEQYLGLAK